MMIAPTPQVSGDQLQAYLDRHFVSLRWLARATSMRKEDVQELIASRCSPGPSYDVLAGGLVNTNVFGTLPMLACLPGAYYAPACASWIRRAAVIRTAERGNLCRTADALHTQFREQYREALQSLQSEAIGINALELVDGVEETIEDWLAGTFGVCTRHPATAHAIARKQLAQRRLSRLTDNGSRHRYTADQAALVLEVMAEYDAAAMPFSPGDYPQSSRKRLVDDLISEVRAASEA